ncbi:MAG: nitroreductase family protein [Spirochaetota bacterium]|nr:nitroreductase family protein [Spirochaetota bacterium]
MDFPEIVRKNRSYRRFDEKKRISDATLKELVDLARLTSSGANLQPLRYHLSWTEEECASVYPTLKWAAYLRDWDGPEEGERPTAYITVARDTEVKDVAAKTDAGIAMQTILLAATHKGIGGCIFASVNHNRLREVIGLDNRYEIMFVIALGVPVEEVVLEPLKDKGAIKYYRDENMVHYVPKLELDDVIV